MRSLLPTPTVAHLRNHDEAIENYEARVEQWRNGELNGKPGVSLGVEVRRALLPTPLVDDSKNDGRNENRYPTLASTVVQATWGKYEPAIRRWEQTINTPAPTATIPDGRDGNHRLNPQFAEWLMGIPNRLDGLDLTRAERLKMAGNGVCPQQAELALTILIDRINTNE
jgi:site-specific DNA-cytosine methylase